MAARFIDALLAHISGRLARDELRPLADADPLERPSGYPGFDPLAARLLARRYRKAKQAALWVCPPYGDDAMLGKLTYLAVERLKKHAPADILGEVAPPPVGFADAWHNADKPRVAALIDAAYQKVRRVNQVPDDATRPPSWLRTPLPTLATLLTLCLLVGGVALLVQRALRPAPRPPLTGIFASGGRRGDVDARYDALFGEQLADWTIATSRVHLARVGKLGGVGELERFERERDEAATRILAAVAFDPPLQARLARLFELARDLPANNAATIAAASAVNLELQTRPKPLPYYLDLDIWTYPDERIQLMLLSYGVDAVVLWDVGGSRYSALEVRRLDKLNVVEHNLGYVREGVHHAIILASKIEEELVRDVLPALSAAPPAPPPTGDDGTPLEPAATGELRALGRALIREELLPELEARVGKDGVAALAHLGDLVRARADLVAAWQRAAPEGITIEQPERLSEGDAYESIATRYGKDGDLAELQRIERAIDAAGSTGKAAWDALAALERASVERHELQHQWDRDHDELPMPDPLAAIAGPGARVAKAELSAYLAEIAEGEGGPRSRLALLIDLVIDPDHASPHKNAAIVTLEELAGVGPEAGLLEGGAVAPERFLAILRTIAARPRETVQADARALYQRLFKRPLPPAKRL